MDRIDAMRLFTRLAEHGSFSAAARDLNIRQSTASKWIAELEAQLGARLVERTTRSVHLTDVGRRFLTRASEMLAAYDDTTRELSHRSSEPAGRVRVSLPVAFGRLFVVAPMVDFLRKHSKVRAELVFSDRYVSLVEEGFDLAIRVGLPKDTSAYGRKLVDSERRVVASPAYLKARGRPITPKDLREHDCLVHGGAAPSTIWRFAQQQAHKAPVMVQGRIAASNSEAVLQMTTAGLGIALLADWLVDEHVKKKELVLLLAEFKAPPAPVYALSPQGRHTPSVVRALVDHLAKALSIPRPASKRVTSFRPTTGPL